MNKKILYSEFSNDLRNLYCKIRHSDIENAYIKIAELLVESFYEWINRPKPVIPSDIKDINVYNSLKLLARLKKSFSGGEKIDKPYIVKNILFENKALVPIIWSFKELLKDIRGVSILDPFSELITNINNAIPPQQTTSDADAIKSQNDLILQDLISIYDFYQKDIIQGGHVGKIQKIGLYEKRYNMMRYLLNRFSGDISSACTSSGLSDLAKYFDNGILAKRANIGIATIIELDPLPSTHSGVARKMVDRAWDFNDLKWCDYNHDYIELRMMNAAGSISYQEYNEIYNKHEMTKDPLLYMSSDKCPGIDSGGKITYNKRLNPDYIHMLSVFFVEFQYRLKIPV